MDRYLPTFYPVIGKKVDEYYSTPSQLRIIIRPGEISDRDLSRLIKYKVKLRNLDVQFNDWILGKECREGLLYLLNNQHPRWLCLVRRNAISQVRLEDSWDRMTIVIKEQYSKPWMKKEEGVPEGFLTELGLDSVTGWDIKFAVYYS